MSTRQSVHSALLGLLLLTGGAWTPAQAYLHTHNLQLSERLASAPLRGIAATIPALPIPLTLSEDIGGSLTREIVLARGEEMIGTDYAYGANREDAVDCSSLIQRMFRTVGIEVPRTTRELVHEGSAVRFSDLAAGDLLFYRWGPSGLHVAVYLAGDRILHASSGAGEVVISDLNDAWQRRMVVARRLL